MCAGNELENTVSCGSASFTSKSGRFDVHLQKLAFHFGKHLCR